MAGILGSYKPDFSEANPGILGNLNPMAVDRMGILSGALHGAAARYRAAQPGPDPTFFHDVGRGYAGPLGGMVGDFLAPPNLNTGDPMADGMNAAMMFGMPAVGMIVKARPVQGGVPGLRGRFGGLKPGDKGVLVNGKLYTHDSEHVSALEQAAKDQGFASLDDAAAKQPEVWEALDENNFGEIDKKGEFIPDAVSKISHAEGVGSVTYDDWLAYKESQR